MVMLAKASQLANFLKVCFSMHGGIVLRFHCCHDGHTLSLWQHKHRRKHAPLVCSSSSSSVALIIQITRGGTPSIFSEVRKFDIL